MTEFTLHLVPDSSRPITGIYGLDGEATSRKLHIQQQNGELFVVCGEAVYS